MFESIRQFTDRIGSSLAISSPGSGFQVEIRTVLPIIALAILMVLAGCSGDNSAGDGTNPATDTTTTVPTDSTAADDSGGDTTTDQATETAVDGQTDDSSGDNGPADSGDSEPTGPVYSPFVFEEGDQYKYDVVASGLSGSLNWEVTDVTGDQVTVHLHGQFGTPFDKTVTGTRDTIRQKLQNTEFGELVTSGLLTPYDSILQDRELAVGNTWSATTSKGAADVSITGTNTYAGVDCYVAEVTINSAVRYTACLAPEHGLAVHSTVTPDGSSVTNELELVEYRTGSSGGDGDDGMDDGDGSDSGTGDNPKRYTHFDFSAGATYEYDVQMGGTPGTFTWEVQDVSGDRITVHTTYQVGGVTFQSTETGSLSSLEGTLEATPAGPFVHQGVFHPFYDHYAGHELEVGNSWSASTSLGGASYEVTGTDTYAGVDCYTTEVRVNGQLRHESCVSPTLGLVVSSTIYDQSGAATMTMTLTAYQSE